MKITEWLFGSKVVSKVVVTPKFTTLKECEDASFESAIAQAMSGQWFNICPINSIASALDVGRQNRAYRLLATLHCVQFSDLAPGIKEALPMLCREALGLAKSSSGALEGK